MKRYIPLFESNYEDLVPKDVFKGMKIDKQQGTANKYYIVSLQKSKTFPKGLTIHVGNATNVRAKAYDMVSNYFDPDRDKDVYSDEDFQKIIKTGVMM